jgi:tetratricopeptide (TPR) repeat protein
MKVIHLIKSSLVFSFLLIALYGCSPAVTTPIVTEEKPSKPTPPPAKESLTSCVTLADLSPGLRSSTEDAFVLYRDQIRYENYEAALNLWKQAYSNAPGANGRATYHFDDGIKIYDHFFKKAETQAEKAALVDTIMSIYDKRVECFDDDGSVVALRAFNSYYSYREFIDEGIIFNQFKEVLDRKGNEADYFIINPFSRMLYDRVLDEKISHDEASKIAYKIFDVIDYGTANCKDKFCEAWEVINEYSPSLLSGLEGIRSFYNCDYYMERYYDQFLLDSTTCDNVTEVYLKMVWAGCDANDPRMVRLKNAKERECYVAPPPPGPLKLAYQALDEGRFKEAISYYEQYIDETEDPDKKAEKLLLISKIYYAHIKNFSASRQYALKAAQNKPNWGEPYILIGKLYASSGPLCGPGRGWDSQIVTWPAIDKFEYAKRIDPSSAAEANKWINQYEKYMPSMDDIFLRQKEVGSSFTVGCWIQENTTIRPAP